MGGKQTNKKLDRLKVEMIGEKKIPKNKLKNSVLEATNL